MPLKNSLMFLSILIVFYSCSTSKKAAKGRDAYPKTAEEIKALTIKIDKAYYSMLGNFSNKTQADTTTSPYCKGQLLKSIPIWQKKGRSHFLCMGWFLESEPTKPIAAGVFQLKKHSKDTFLLNFYDLPQNINHETIWTDSLPFFSYELSDLNLREGCSSFLVYEGNDIFSVSNDETPCFKNISAHMKYFDMNATFSPSMQIHSNSFFNDKKESSIAYPKIYYERLVK